MTLSVCQLDSLQSPNILNLDTFNVLQDNIDTERLDYTPAYIPESTFIIEPETDISDVISYIQRLSTGENVS